jgi:hypothetical protein
MVFGKSSPPTSHAPPLCPHRPHLTLPYRALSAHISRSPPRALRPHLTLHTTPSHHLPSMASREHPRSLAELPIELRANIVGRVAATSKQPMDDLRSLCATCKYMLGPCRDRDVGRQLALDRVPVQDVQNTDSEGMTSSFVAWLQPATRRSASSPGSTTSSAGTAARVLPSMSYTVLPRPGTEGSLCGGRRPLQVLQWDRRRRHCICIHETG